MTRRTLNTRLIMICGALGVALGLVLVPTNLATAGLMTAAPLVVLALMGLWLLPPFLALALLRRPGCGLLTSVIAGLVTVPLTPFGWMGLVQGALWGVLCELPFLITRYRRWNLWLFVCTGVVIAAVGLIPTYTTYGLDDMTMPVRVSAILLTLASCAVAGALAVLLARGLVRAGVKPSLGAR